MSFKHPWRLSAFAALAGLVAAPLVATPALASTDGLGVVINEAYLSGGSANAPYLNKFVELYNPGATPVDVSGWSIQYRKLDGVGASSTVVPLSGSIAAGGYYLVSGSSNGANGVALPTPDVTSSLSPQGQNGTLALVASTAAVTLPTGSVVADPAIVDLLGYGTSNTFETAASPSPSGNAVPQSIVRTDFADTDSNAADFGLSDTVTPQNSAGDTPVDPEPTPDPEPSPEPTDPTTPVEPGVATIAEIQGTAAASTMVGQTVTTKGFVTASFPTGGFNGYYLQTEGTGGAIDPATHLASDGVFVYSPSTVGSVTVGQYVQVTGVVDEYYGLTQLKVTDAAAVTPLDATGVTAPTAATVAFPATDEERERLEGMLLAPAGDYTVTDTYATNRYGEVGLAASDSPFVTPTVLGKPGSAEALAAAARVPAEKVVLDDGSTVDFSKAENTGIPLPYVSTTAPVRVGAAVAFTAPVVFDFRNSNWKFQPTQHLTGANAAEAQPATFENTRTTSPRGVGGDVSLATFNVLNYFATTGDSRTGCTFFTDREGGKTTVDDSDASGCGVRGAATAESLARQQAKIVSAINALDADVVSLEEIQNSASIGLDRDDALKTLTAALNAAAGEGTWTFVPSPAKVPADEDVIRTAFIYKSATVETVGESRILLDEPAFDNAREPDAQAFKPKGADDAATFLVIANHFKSKSTSKAATGDNANTGQGAFTGDRTRQAKALVTFADTVSKDVGTKKVFLVGDFNSYDAEDPLDVLRDAGYISQEAKTGEYTYAYDGAVGSLDHIFASPEADQSVTGADVWNINSVESIALEYSRYNANVTDFNVPDMFRSSDHDPVIVGISADASESATVNLLNINDFHGRIDANTTKFAGTIEQLKSMFAPDQTAFISAGDNIGASLFASSSQQDQPTIDVLNALGLKASAVGNHEFDQGYGDLVDRVMADGKNAAWPYLGANVYEKGTKKPALQEYTILDIDGVKVAIVGAITQETPTLVSPAGIADLDFGDPVEAVNRVAAQLSDGDESNGEADVIVAEYHEGAGAGTPDGATLEQELAEQSAFTSIVTTTSAEVDAIFTGHTHKQYAWDAPVPGVTGKTRPVLQTGSYGEFIGQITLTVDRESGDVTAYSAKNVARTTVAEADLVKQYPAVATVKTITDKALAVAAEIGNQKIGEATADITRAFNNGVKDDRGAESTLGALVADSLRASLSSADRGGADIGIVNPGGMREEILAGDITYAEANAVLPFLNNLWTTSLTGAQFKTVLEQQWQRDAAGAVPSRPYLQLGLSSNVQYTFDPTRAEGDRITSIAVNGAAIDPAKSYRIGSFSFLLQGGDNFREFANGTDTRDSGLVDRDAWISYLTASSPVSPDFARQSVQVTNVPAAAVAAGAKVSFDVAKLDLTSTGSPVNTSLAVELNGSPVGTVPVSAGAATVSFTVPAGTADGAATVRLTALESGTTLTVPLTVATPPVVTPPTPAPDSALIQALKDLIKAITDFIIGKLATIHVGKEYAGTWVSVWLHSDPILVSDGLVQVDADGNVQVTVPEDAPVGAHRLVVQDVDGNVIGWQDIVVQAAAVDPGTDPGTQPGAGGGTGSGSGTAGGSKDGSLSNTGAEPWGNAALAALLLVGGLALVIARRRSAQQL